MMMLLLYPYVWKVHKEEQPCIIPEKNVKLGIFNAALADGVSNEEELIHQGKKGDDSDGPLVKAGVLCLLTDENGNIVGIPNEDLKLYTAMYELEFLDGRREPYAANVITQETYSQLNL